MNIKKGLIRLFIVASVLSAIGGFFYTAPDSQSSTSFSIETIWSIEKNLDDPSCAVVVKQNPVKFPAMNPTFACSPLSIYWESIKQYQSKNPSKYQAIDKALVNDAMWERIRSQQREIALAGLALGFAWNLFVWILALIAYFTFRWIKKGFKS